MFLWAILCSEKVSAQFTLPSDTTTYWIQNQQGVMIPIKRNPDSTIVKGQLLIRFRQGALDYDKLMSPYLVYYDIGPRAHHKGNQILSFPELPHDDTSHRGFPDSLRFRLLTEHFYFDSSNNIITDSTLRNFFISSGGFFLRRLTTASPVDTLSITRRGDTLGCDHYNWMLLNYDTTVNALLLCAALKLNFPHDILMALPDRNGTKFFKHPGDNLKFYDSCEVNLKRMINAEKAWDFEVGNPSIILAHFDQGVDYRHPDLGAGIGPSKHVLYGHQFYVSSTGSIDPINMNQGHGTPCIGIMGALTNRNATSIAGIAGGWGVLPSDSPGSQDLGMGCSLAILASGATGYKSAYIAAVFESASRSASTFYGTGVNVINTSASIANDGYSEPDLHGAINYAFENGVIQCGAMGEINYNENAKPVSFPAEYEQSWVIGVGGSRFEDAHPLDKKTKAQWSNYGFTMGLLAPSGDTQFGCTIAGPGLNYSTINSQSPTILDPLNEIHNPIYTYGSFAGTSASAPNVAGSAGLILSWFTRPYSGQHVALEPEDVYGIIKASASMSLAQTAWDTSNGWGHLDIGQAFKMLDPDSTKAAGRYVLYHYSFSNWLDSSAWTTDSTVWFFNKACSPVTQGNHRLEKYQNRTYLLNDLGRTAQESKYFAKVRSISKTISLDSIWDVKSTTPLFAWGRSGSLGEKSGWDFSQFNFQSGYSRVNDGTGGDTLNEGIYHSQNTTFTVVTAQYDVWAWDTTTHAYTDHIGHVPPDSMLGVNFSVFGKLQSSRSDVNQIQPSQKEELVVFVNSDRELVVDYTAPAWNIRSSIEIYDILGRLVVTYPNSTKVLGRNRFSTFTNLNSGTYVCRINNGTFTKSKSFQIVR